MILDRNNYVAVWNHLTYSTHMDAANTRTQLSLEAPMFSVNQIVAGKNAGVFVILSFRIGADGERWANLKEINPVTQKTYPGGLSLPESSLREYH